MSALPSHPAAKCCIGCGATKPLDAFYNHKSARDGRQSRCKACDNNTRVKRGLAPNLSRADGGAPIRRVRRTREAELVVDDEPEVDVQPFVVVDEATEVLCARVFRQYDREVRERDAADGRHTPAAPERDGVEWTTLDQHELERWLDRVRLVGDSGPVAARSEAARANGLMTPAPADSSASAPFATVSSSDGPEKDDVAPAPEVAPPRVRGASLARASPRVFLAPVAGPAEIKASTSDVAPERDAAGATCEGDLADETEKQPMSDEEQLTANQEAVLKAFRAYAGKHKAEPQNSWLMEQVGGDITSGSICNALTALRAKGLIPAKGELPRTRRNGTIEGRDDAPVERPKTERAKVKEAPRAAAPRRRPSTRIRSWRSSGRAAPSS